MNAEDHLWTIEGGTDGPEAVPPEKEETGSEKPQTEQTLFRLQQAFLEARSEKNARREQEVMRPFFTLLVQYSRSLLLQKLKNNAYLDKTQVESLAHNIATKLVERYYRSPEFTISGSFAGYLSCKVREELYSDSEEDKHLSLDQPAGKNKKQKFENLQSVARIHPLFASHTDAHPSGEVPVSRDPAALAREVAQAITHQVSIVSEEEGYATALRVLNSILLHIRFGERVSRAFLSQEPDPVQSAFDTTLLVLYRRLREEGLLSH